MVETTVAGWDGAAWQRWSGPVAVACVVGFCLLVAADRLGSRFLAAAGVLAVGYGALRLDVGDPAAALVEVAPWVALAVLVGTVTHVAGDLATECGLYALAPLYRTGEGQRRQHWVRIALPKWLAFRTGGWFEQGVVLPLLVVAGVLVAPGVWPVVHPVLTALG